MHPLHNKDRDPSGLDYIGLDDIGVCTKPNPYTHSLPLQVLTCLDAGNQASRIIFISAWPPHGLRLTP
jgi:hypothetical protein